MGRMFRIITEGAPERPDRPGPVGLSADPAVETIPFVEVGGPEGVVTSIRPTVVRPVEPIAPVTASEPEPTPPPASDDQTLSVEFHRFTRTASPSQTGAVAADVIAFHDPNHPVADEYRAVRDQARRQLIEHGPRVLLFTAASPAVGATTVILNLAVALTEDRQGRVLVLDANFDRPGVAGRLGVLDRPGLAEVLELVTPLAWAVQPTAVPNLHALPCGVPTDGTAEAMSRDFPRLLSQLRQWFDWVLVDAGIWAEVLGGEVIGPASDAVYLVTRHEDRERPEFHDLRAAIAACGGLPRGYITTRK